MKRSSIIEARRKSVKPETRKMVDLSFRIVDRIHSILEMKGLKQKDLAVMLGKNESEISKWMRGTHNFTIETLALIEQVLGEPIITVPPVMILRSSQLDPEPAMASEDEVKYHKQGEK